MKDLLTNYPPLGPVDKHQHLFCVESDVTIPLAKHEVEVSHLIKDLSMIENSSG